MTQDPQDKEKPEGIVPLRRPSESLLEQVWDLLLCSQVCPSKDQCDQS
jgi:hypothetical protein